MQIYHEYPNAIELLFTDVVMPKMSGRQLTDLLRPFRPNMKVLYMSGYTDDAMMRHGIEGAGINFLAKLLHPGSLGPEGPGERARRHEIPAPGPPAAAQGCEISDRSTSLSLIRPEELRTQ